MAPSGAAIQGARDEGCTVRVGNLSTLISGSEDQVFAALRAAFRAAQRSGPAVLTATLAAGMPTDELVGEIQAGMAALASLGPGNECHVRRSFAEEEQRRGLPVSAARAGVGRPRLGALCSGCGRRARWSWSAALAVAVGVIFWGWGLLWSSVFQVIPFPFSYSLVGLWMVGGLLVPFVIRRPGSALLVSWWRPSSAWPSVTSGAS